MDIDIIWKQEHLIWYGDWDNLIVLDACRFDLWDKVNYLDGVLTPVWSPAGCTRHWADFMMKRKYPDVCMVSGSFFFNEYSSSFFYHWNGFKHAWNEELEAVDPVKVVKHAIMTKKMYPKHRLIAWFMQPHVPFLGEHSLRARDFGTNIYLLNLERLHFDARVPIDYIKKGYEENLEYVLPHIERLCKNLEGKTIITSDHGNCLGEYGKVGHEERIQENIPELRLVPWFEVIM